MTMKAGYIATTVTADPDGTIYTHLFFCDTQDEAQSRLNDFIVARDPETGSFPMYAELRKGNLSTENPDYVEGGDAKEYLKVPGTYCVKYQKVTIDTDELEDAERDYTVEVDVTRKWTFEMEVTATSEDDAEDKARQAIMDGDEEHQMECPDDEEVDILNCTES